MDRPCEDFVARAVSPLYAYKVIGPESIPNDWIDSEYADPIILAHPELLPLVVV